MELLEELQEDLLSQVEPANGMPKIRIRQNGSTQTYNRFLWNGPGMMSKERIYHAKNLGSNATPFPEARTKQLFFLVFQ